MHQLLANEMKIDYWKVSVGYGFLQAYQGKRHDGCGIRGKLGEMIPEYMAGDSECVL